MLSTFKNKRPYKSIILLIHLVSHNLLIYYVKILLLVNDGSGKLPACRGLVNAVQSIVRTGGLKGLYQVIHVHSCTAKLALSLVTCLVLLCLIEQCRLYIYIIFQFNGLNALSC